MDMLLSDSDWESFSETDSTEDRDNFYGGQASCILSSLEETIGKIDEFLSFGREFLLGDIVCSITNPCGHMGRVVGIDMLVDLENSNGTVLKDIDSKKLSKIQSISIGDFVVSGSWLGRVDKVIDRVNIVFDNGGKCGITVMDPDELVPIITPNMFEDSQYPYYPGQRVMVKHSSSIFRSSRRVFGPWKDNQDEGTVCSTEAGIVYVDWLTSILSGSSSLPSPNSLQDPKNLTLLSCYSHENWQLGDWCILPNEEKNAILREDFGNEHNKLEISGEIFIITKMKSKVDVIWQDGSYSSRLDSQALLPSNFVNSHEFWPGQFVLEKGIFEDARIALSHRWGVVEAFDSKEKIVKVRWRRVPEGEFNDVNGHCLEETMSAYELVEHPDYSFCFGDVVFKLDRNKYGDLDEDKDHQDEYLGKYLSCIGSVTGFKDGVVEVRWASGSSTKVAPFEIFRVDQSECSTSTPAVYEENVDELRQDATQCGKQSLTQNGKELMSFDSAGKSCEKHSRECHLSCLPEAAIGFLSSIATSLFGSLGLTSLSTCHHICKDETENKILLQGEEKMEETCDTNFTESYKLSTNLEEFKTTSFNQTKAEEVSENKECSYSLFKQFDMISDCSDHHFIGAGMSPTTSQIRRCWLKKVHEEWNILEKNLPETIFVRVYEERMDLMRAAIIGAPGTPYHDGIFFFDILLPPEYPHEPPSVHYISGGLRANPNLYESGKVCLSLLNTWTGTGNEVWNPKSSTILQVLLSLQALVLNEKPYFNEAGYDKQVGREEGEKNSVSYNENAFLVTCKSMLYLLSKPPKHFELFVEQHFRHRSEPIIQACSAYMKGTAVGCACYRYEDETGENDCETSMGFKIMLGKIVPKLIEVFTMKEIDCTKFSGPEN